MTKEEFKKMFGEFAEGYNTAYTAPMAQKLFDFVQPLHAAEFGWKLQQIMETEMRAPNIGKIKSVMAESVGRARLVEMDRTLKSEPYCEWCDNTGQISAVKKDDGISCALRCSKCRCADIRNLSRELVPWRDEFFADLNPVKYKKPKIWPHKDRKISAPMTVNVIDVSKLTDSDIPF